MRRVVLGSTTDASNLYAPPETDNKTTLEQKGLLVISDDPALSHALGPRLLHLGLKPRWAMSYHDALDQTPNDWQAVVLDLLVPRTERYSICREVRATFGLPVIMVDERPDDALDTTLGADFYLDKPITAESIWASLHTLKSRQQLKGDTPARGELVLFSDASAAFVDGRLLELSDNEFSLLALLVRSEGEVVTRSELGRSISNGAADLDQDLIDIHVVRLMAKLATRSSRRIVRSAKLDGYLLLAART